jgi:hypothetical protein
VAESLYLFEFKRVQCILLQAIFVPFFFNVFAYILVINQKL